MSRFWSPRVHTLAPYVPGEQPRMARLVKLNTNENPYGPSPRVCEAIRQLADDRLRLYPDPDAMALREAIGRYHGVAPSEVFVGNGSDEVLAHVFMALFQPDAAIQFPDITYSFYPVYCRLYGLQQALVPLRDDLSLVTGDFSTPNGGIIFPNPNAPTGRLVSLDDIRALLECHRDSVVVIDEAYIDFGGETAIPLIHDYPNLLVVQTLSKSRALAGLRIGFAIGQEPLIDGLRRVKDSFNSYPLDQLAIAAGVAAYEDQQWFQTRREWVMENRAAMHSALVSRGFEVVPSSANFLLARHPRYAGQEMARMLRNHGVVVRHFSQPERIAAFVRITVGTAEQNQCLLDALAAEGVG